MKSVSVLLGILLSASLSNAETTPADGLESLFGLKAVGSANVSACEESFGDRSARKEAELEAKLAADAQCKNLRFESAVVKNVEVIGSYSGSCWAGSDNGVAVLISVTCVGR